MEFLQQSKGTTKMTKAELLLNRLAVIEAKMKEQDDEDEYDDEEDDDMGAEYEKNGAMKRKNGMKMTDKKMRR